MKRQFGRYIINDDVKDELGRGAFGRVYRALDPNVNRYVAVKVLSSASDPEMLNRFRDESKTAGKLEHENIVKVYDFVKRTSLLCWDEAALSAHADDIIALAEVEGLHAHGRAVSKRKK